MNNTLAQTLKTKGLLLEKDIYDLVNEIGNTDSILRFIDTIVETLGQKMITKQVLTQHVNIIQKIVGRYDAADKQTMDTFLVKLGITVEVTRENTPEQHETPAKEHRTDFKIFYADTFQDKKLEMTDFSGHFRSRYSQIQRMLMGRSELASKLISINKISSDRSTVAIIGIVTEKRITKNKNMIIRFEDLTGEINALVKCDKEDLFPKAEELQLDDVVGIKASGNRDMLFVHDILFPDAFLTEKTTFTRDISVAFISDVHAGSDRHLGKSFQNFITWLNTDDENAQKIRYLFISGDTVDGIGVFPGQEKVLKLTTMEEQYELLASYLKNVPKRITMFLCPGQHDATRVAEPQPIISKKYAHALYDIENLILVTNPSTVQLIEGEKEFNILMYHGASIHSFINEIRELRLMKAHRCPAKAICHMLKRRHLAPTHSEVVYIPNANKDPLVIETVPDVLCTGEVHRLDIENYNNVLIITGSCWQAQPPFEEKVGNEPDPCKVPVLNLKTRELKVFDFTDTAELNKTYD